MKTIRLSHLKPGDMFRRETGTFRYVVSTSREELCGNAIIYCYNLDGEKEGYWWAGDKQVTPISPSGYSTQFEPKSESLPCRPKTFYMCYAEGGGFLSSKHPTKWIAQKVAESLAKRTGKRVFILETVSSVDYTPPQYASCYWYENLRQRNC